MSLRRMLLLTAITVAVASSAGESFAQGGLFASLNKSLVPTAPGLPTASPLGLISPRLSNAVSIFQLGGMRTPAGRLSALGVLSPRLSPVVAMVRTPPATPQARRTYGLTLLSPRLSSFAGMLRGFRGMAAGLR
ncbi:MAG: hypothetical protein K8S94_16875 [Planctomycetia bacterium]|nr:hypothetical protein [Planctomycetia bacterium]